MSKKLKIGLIGSGGIAQGLHMPAYAHFEDMCEMVAVCDINEETAKKCAEKYNIKTVVTDYKDLLAIKEIDAVSVTTPNAAHMQPTIDALAAGKHVLCEKPLAMNAEEARKMCKAAKDAKKILMVALPNRFNGPATFLKKYIDAGRMGDIYFARAQALRRRGVPGWGVFINKDLQGGGPLIDIGVHILDLTLFLMGYPKPVSASGKTWDMLGKNPDIVNPWGEYDRSKFTVEDFAVGLIKFDNGAVVSLESSFMGNMDGDPFNTQLFGTKSGALVSPWAAEPVKIYTEENKQLFDMIPKNIQKINAGEAEVEAFMNAINEKKPSPVPGMDGLILNAIFDALYKSSETGKEQPVDVSF
jgi:predicted dehydrogenase